jgi:hypothetical protein
MTEPPPEQPTAEQPAPTPTVSTAPPTRRRIPSHLGPARTSTVVLAVLWLALGTLYLNVRPPAPATAGSTGTTVETTAPGRATTAPAPTTAAPTTATTTETGASTTPAETTETTTNETTETTTPVETTAPSSTVLPTTTIGGTPTG